MGKTFHIANIATVSAGHFVDVASDFFGFRKPEFIPLKDFDMATRTHVQQSLIEPFIPYCNYTPPFDVANTIKALGKSGFSCPKIDDRFLHKLFKFCVDKGFIRPKRRYVAQR